MRIATTKVALPEYVQKYGGRKGSIDLLSKHTFVEFSTGADLRKGCNAQCMTGAEAASSLCRIPRLGKDRIEDRASQYRPIPMPSSPEATTSSSMDSLCDESRHSLLAIHCDWYLPILLAPASYVLVRASLFACAEVSS